jgi:hypothetical protein
MWGRDLDSESGSTDGHGTMLEPIEASNQVEVCVCTGGYTLLHIMPTDDQPLLASLVELGRRATSIVNGDQGWGTARRGTTAAVQLPPKVGL